MGFGVGKDRIYEKIYNSMWQIVDERPKAVKMDLWIGLRIQMSLLNRATAGVLLRIVARDVMLEGEGNV